MSCSPLRPLVRSAIKAPTLTLRRAYAAKPGPGNPNVVVQSDSRSDLLRQSLYPADSYAPTSSSPTGSYHPDHLARLQAVIPDAEAHETIERAWKLHQRKVRNARAAALDAKFSAMVEACNELEAITSASASPSGPEAEAGKGGLYHRIVYERAMAELTQAERRGEDKHVRGKKSVEQRWKDTRIEGLVPREMWVPTETRGKGWNYEWTRPGQ